MKHSFKKVGVVGAGSWGTALALLLERNGLAVNVWGHDPEAVGRIRRDRENIQYLPGVALPESIVFTDAIEDLADADLLLLVPPSHALREVALRLAGVPVARDATLVSCTKGLERGTGKRMSELLADVLPGRPLAVLSGPSHAEEVARQAPTAIVLGCTDPALLPRLQATFSHAAFRPYTSADVTGIELGGTLKNIFAIGAGVCDGLGLGDNAKAAFLTRSLAEMVRLGTALGGSRETFYGLSGVGDLMVTCFSKHSRNRAVGERLGKGESLARINGSSNMVAEGVLNTFSASECARRFNIEAPLIEHIRLLLEGRLTPAAAITALMTRDARSE